MNQRTAKILRKVANHLQVTERSAKKAFNSLTAKEKDKFFKSYRNAKSNTSNKSTN